MSASSWCRSGYLGDVIRRYFLDYATMRRTIQRRSRQRHGRLEERAPAEPWRVHLVETGDQTNTGGRVCWLLERWLKDETFFLTYGDGVSDVDLARLLAFHRAHGRLATVTAVRPPARFGGLELDGDRVTTFTEKPEIGEGWINGGFFVFEPGVFDTCTATDDSLEHDAAGAAWRRTGQLSAYRHTGFWQSMDTLRDVRLLQSLWASDSPPWKVWS